MTAKSKIGKATKGSKPILDVRGASRADLAARMIALGCAMRRQSVLHGAKMAAWRQEHRAIADALYWQTKDFIDSIRGGKSD
jgi:hypothetical protein